MNMGEHARPFLLLHMGQAGTQIGNAIWELFCLEHNIQHDGNAKDCPSHGFYDAMFLRNASGHFMPRSIFVDTDPTCINEIRVGPYRELFSASQLLSEHNDAAGNYMRGRRDFSDRLVPETLERFRWLSEKTDITPAVFLIHGLGGGTGTGLATSCLESLRSEVGTSMQVMEISVSSGRSGMQSSTELINSTLYQYESREFTDVSFNVTNSAMFNVCRSGLSLSNATYAHVNRMLAMCFSNLTSMERFPGSVPVNLASICSNVLPFRQLKTPLLACSPFSTADTLGKERLNTIGVTSAVMEPDAQFADADLRQGKHMAGVLLYRGAAKSSDVDQALNALRAKNRAEFVDWAPPSFRYGLMELPPLSVPNSGIAGTSLSVTLVSNSTAVASLYRGQSEAIKKLMTKVGKCFLHRYDNNVGGGGGNDRGGGTSAGHNSSDVETLLMEACDHMDSMADMYASELPPDRQKQATDQESSPNGEESKTATSQPPPSQRRRRSAEGSEARVGVYKFPDASAGSEVDGGGGGRMQEDGAADAAAGMPASSDQPQNLPTSPSQPSATAPETQTSGLSSAMSATAVGATAGFAAAQMDSTAEPQSGKASQQLGTLSQHDSTGSQAADAATTAATPQLGSIPGEGPSSVTMGTSVLTTPTETAFSQKDASEAQGVTPPLQSLQEAAPASTADSTVTHGPQDTHTLTQSQSTPATASESGHTGSQPVTPKRADRMRQKKKSGGCCKKKSSNGESDDADAEDRPSRSLKRGGGECCKKKSSNGESDNVGAEYRPSQSLKRGSGGCCRKRSKDTGAKRAAQAYQTGAPRSQSQNHANSYGVTVSRHSSDSSLRSASCVNLESYNNRYPLADATYSSEERATLGQSARYDSSASVPSAESATDLSEIIQDCQPGPMPVISSVKEIIQKYNQMFANKK